jgi:dUTP pyrophosphatase
MNIKVRLIREDALLPERASNLAVGYDVFASRVLDKFTKEAVAELPVELLPAESVLIGIGVQFAIPWPYQCEVRPRSGLASKYDIELSNSPGTIDPDFRGEAGILLRNRGKNPFTVEKGMRVAQLVFSEVQIPVLELTDELLPTVRGCGGFGSTGLFEIKEGTEAFRREIEKQDRFYMSVAIAIAERSNCVRGVKKDGQGRYLRDEQGNFIGQTRKFGCIIVKNDNIISMGYNAQHKGSPLCSEVGCLRDAEKIPSGTKLERCRAMHAEWWAFSNLMVSGVGVSTKGATMYLNAEPCEICAKLIAQNEIETLVLLEGVYPNNGVEIVRKAGICLRYVKV